MLLPTYFWPQPLLVFYPLDYYCSIEYKSSVGLYCTIVIVYFLPIGLITAIYARILHFINHQTPQLLQAAHGRRAHRDLVVIRRILFTVNNLMLPGLPNTAFVILVAINPAMNGSFQMYRIQWMSPGVALWILSMALVPMTPRLKSLVMGARAARSNEVVPHRQMGHTELAYPSALVTNRSHH